MLQRPPLISWQFFSSLKQLILVMIMMHLSKKIPKQLILVMIMMYLSTIFPKQLMLVMMRLLCLASEHNVATEAFLNGPLRPKTRKTYRRRNFLCNRKKDIHLNDELVKRNMFYCRSWQRCNDTFSQSLESKHLGPRKMIM